MEGQDEQPDLRKDENQGKAGKIMDGLLRIARRMSQIQLFSILRHSAQIETPMATAWSGGVQGPQSWYQRKVDWRLGRHHQWPSTTAVRGRTCT